MARVVAQAFPDVEVVFACDQAHMPYGSKTKAELIALALPVLQGLQAQGCAIIVVACNTVTTTCIRELRELLDVPLIGIEPMVKPAAELTSTGVITVCATPATLASERYAWLKQTYGAACRFIEPDCSAWAQLIEQNAINEAHIQAALAPALAEGTDVIVLGCTHYHWIEQDIRRMCGETVTVLQPETAIMSRVKQIAAALEKAG